MRSLAAVMHSGSDLAAPVYVTDVAPHRIRAVQVLSGQPDTLKGLRPRRQAAGDHEGPTAEPKVRRVSVFSRCSLVLTHAHLSSCLQLRRPDAPQRPGEAADGRGEVSLGSDLGHTLSTEQDFMVPIKSPSPAEL